jgi:hypothetical protein
MGYDHSTPRDLIFGPEEFGGFYIRHLLTEMMGMKLDSIISDIISTINNNYHKQLSKTNNQPANATIDCML